MFHFTIFFVLQISSGLSAYFTMKNVTINMFNKTGVLQSSKLLNLYAQGKGILTYQPRETEEIAIVPGNGLVYLRQFRNQSKNKEIPYIASEARVSDISSEMDFTTLTINFNSKPKDSCNDKDVNRNICFWSNVTYQIKENTIGTIIGSLSSYYSINACPKKRLDYKLESSVGEIELVPPNQMYNIWSLGTTIPLNRKTHGAKIQANITCTIRDVDVKTFTRLIAINILDIDNFPPVPQAAGKDIKINMDDYFIKKLSSPLSKTRIKNTSKSNKSIFFSFLKSGVILHLPPPDFPLLGYEIHHSSLVFLDDDTIAVNNFNSFIITKENDEFLQPKCNSYRDPRNETTVIHCKLIFQANKQFHTPTYNVMLFLNDTTLNNKTAKSEAVQNVSLVFKRSTQTVKPLLLYPDKVVKIFRTAAPFARLTQPKKSVTKIQNFTLKEKYERSKVFNITDEGIVYLADFAELRKAAEFIKIRIVWFKKNSTKYDDIEVRIIDESNVTCKNISSDDEWTFCAQYKSYHDCVKPTSCAVGTGGSSHVEKRKHPERCFWRGDKRPGNEITNHYSTCTPDSKYCPDGYCDSLEIILEDEICPQDCTTRTMFPTQLNQKTYRGVDACSGLLHCSSFECICDTQWKFKLLDIDDKIPEQITFNNQTEFKKLLGISKAKCGRSCILGITVVILVVIGVCVTLIFWRMTNLKRSIAEKYNQDNQEMIAPLSTYTGRFSVGESLQLNFRMAESLSDMLFSNNTSNYDLKWEFPRNQLSIEQTLGEGEFGRVLKARALNIAGHLGYSDVAVKTLKDDAGESEFNDLLSEYHMLKEVSHKNVIRLLGVCTTANGPPYLIIEFAEFGSLRNYLRQSRQAIANIENNHYEEINVATISPAEIMSFAWQICNGMSYLSDVRLVHRDLAARNVLLAKDKICKISDFGLTRDIYEDNAYFKKSKGRVPVKWMAPESLADHLYTTKSDVWSFGVLVWELVTLGTTPYPGIAVQNLYNLLLQGYRMEKPPNCSPILYCEMTRCWQLNPADRPTFQELASTFGNMLSDKNEYLNLNATEVVNKSYFSTYETDKPSDGTVNLESSLHSAEKHHPQEKTIEVLNKCTNQYVMGYETPVKRPAKPETPENEHPEEYTTMGNSYPHYNNI